MPSLVSSLPPCYLSTSGGGYVVVAHGYVADVVVAHGYGADVVAHGYVAVAHGVGVHALVAVCNVLVVAVVGWKKSAGVRGAWGFRCLSRGW